jgi:hypothetical protein
MKTTIDLPRPLLEAAKRLARQEGTTLRGLVELGLRTILRGREQKGAFKLRDASFRGEGLQPGVTASSWESIRDSIYEGRGA